MIARPAQRAGDVQAIAFEDDSLLVHRGRFLQLAGELVRRGVGLPWMANARPDELDEERVAAAAAAGAVLLKVGGQRFCPGDRTIGEDGGWCGVDRRHLARHWRHYLSVAGLARAPCALAYLLRGA